MTVRKICTRVAGSVLCVGVLACAGLHAKTPNPGMDGLNEVLQTSLEAAQAVMDGKSDTGRELSAQAFEKVTVGAPNALAVNAQGSAEDSLKTGNANLEHTGSMLGEEKRQDRVPPPQPPSSPHSAWDKVKNIGVTVGGIVAMPITLPAALGWIAFHSGLLYPIGLGPDPDNPMDPPWAVSKTLGVLSTVASAGLAAGLWKLGLPIPAVVATHVVVGFVGGVAWSFSRWTTGKGWRR